MGLIAVVAIFVVARVFDKKEMYTQLFLCKGIVYGGVIVLSFFSGYWGSEKNLSDLALTAAVIMTAVFELMKSIEEYCENKKAF